MPQFSNKFKNTAFDSFLGQKKISWKIRLCHAQLHMGFQHHAKIKKKLMIQFKENTQTDGRKDRGMEGRGDPILQDPSSYCRGSKKTRKLDKVLMRETQDTRTKFIQTKKIY